MNKWMFVFSMAGIIGAVLVALKIVAPGFAFWIISDVGMIITIWKTGYAKEQMFMWIVYTIISLIGLFNWMG